MNRARLYGLGIETEFFLPDWFVLDTSSRGPDVIVRIGSPQGKPAADSSQFGAERSVLVFPGWLDADVLDGREIVVHPGPECDEKMLALLVAGPALAVALRQRGSLVLHGSAVRASEGCIAILGPSGSGKSTAAARLVESGLQLVADDVVAITPSMNGQRVQPAYPLVKLWPEAARLIGRDPTELPVVEAGDRGLKRGLRVSDFATDPAPLSKVVVIRPDQVDFASIRGPEAVKAISDNLYVPPYRVEEGQWKGDFSSIAALVSEVEVFQVEREALSGPAVQGLLERGD